MLTLVVPMLLTAQENFEVRAVGFAGNSKMSSELLLERMTTYATSSFKKTFLRKKPFKFSKIILADDLEKLKRFYQRQGFLHVSIDKPKLEVNSAKKTIKIAINIKEGEPIVVRKVAFVLPSEMNGNSEPHLQIVERVRPALRLKEGQRFRDPAAQADQAQLITFFRNSAYPYIEVKPELNVDESGRFVAVTWRISTGPKSTFGEVNISGNHHTPADLIRNRLAFEEGQPYRQKLLDASQENVYGLGMFHFVTVKANLSSTQNPAVPVTVVVKEAPRLSNKFGAGYGREDKIRVFSDLQLLGALGGARRLNLFLKHSALEPYRADLRLTQPLTVKTALVLNPFLVRQNEPGFEVRRFGSSLQSQFHLSQTVNGSAGYTFERINLDRNGSESEASDRQAIALYNKSSTTMSLVRDNTSPAFSPNRGMLSTLAVIVSGLGVGSEFHSTKVLVDVRRYQKITDNLVVAYRTKLGLLESFDKDEFVPVEDRFFAGGISSVRGWARSELGPLNELGKPTGGKSLFEGSIELRQLIVGPLSGALFTDFGNVWSDSFGYDFNDLRYSLGLGFRYQTPIGPIRLDVVRPVFDEEKTVQFFVTVGHAF